MDVSIFALMAAGRIPGPRYIAPEKMAAEMAKQYDLIMAKKSDLSRAERNRIIAYCERNGIKGGAEINGYKLKCND